MTGAFDTMVSGGVHRREAQGERSPDAVGAERRSVERTLWRYAHADARWPEFVRSAAAALSRSGKPLARGACGPCFAESTGNLRSRAGRTTIAVPGNRASTRRRAQFGTYRARRIIS